MRLVQVFLTFAVLNGVCVATREDLFDVSILKTAAPSNGNVPKAGPLPGHRWLRFNHSDVSNWFQRRAVYIFDGEGLEDAANPPLSWPCGVWFSAEAQVVVLTHASEPWLLDVLGAACGKGRGKGGPPCFKPLSKLLTGASAGALEVRLQS